MNYHTDQEGRVSTNNPGYSHQSISQLALQQTNSSAVYPFVKVLELASKPPLILLANTRQYITRRRSASKSWLGGDHGGIQMWTSISVQYVE